MIRRPLLFLLVLSLPALADDNFEVSEPSASDVDPTAYLQALHSRFSTCLVTEGTIIAPEDSATVTEALDTLAPLFRTEAGSVCTSSVEAVVSCASDIRTAPCATLYEEIRSVLEGGPTGPVAPWATSYATAMSERIGQCYTAEVGAPLETSQQSDLDFFGRMVATMLGQFSSSCAVDQDRLGVCSAEIRNLSCTDMAVYLASDTDLMVNQFMARCEGWLDCGFKE